MRMVRRVLMDEGNVIKTTFTNEQENIAIIVTRDTYDAVPRYKREKFLSTFKWEWEADHGYCSVPAGEVVLELEDFDWDRHKVRMAPVKGKGKIVYGLDAIIKRIRPKDMDYGHME